MPAQKTNLQRDTNSVSTFHRQNITCWWDRCATSSDMDETNMGKTKSTGCSLGQKLCRPDRCYERLWGTSQRIAEFHPTRSSSYLTALFTARQHSLAQTGVAMLARKENSEPGWTRFLTNEYSQLRNHNAIIFWTLAISTNEHPHPIYVTSCGSSETTTSYSTSISTCDTLATGNNELTPFLRYRGIAKCSLQQM